MDVQKYSSARILVVDDEPSNVVLLDRMLRRAGYAYITGIQDSRDVMQAMQDVQPDLILLDLMMPYVDGYTILTQLHEQLPPEQYLPVMVLTADVSPQALQRALSSGARDFVTKPFDQTELLLRAHNLLETRHLYRSLQQQLSAIDELYQQAQRAIEFRDQTLSALSHDIGQPLAAIRLSTEILQEQTKDEEPAAVMMDDLERIDAASNQMAAMIAEMSDLARLHMGRGLVLHRKPVDLVALAREQVALSKRVHSRHKVRLQSDAEMLEGNWDAMRITRVLSNLLSNAVKFSPPRSSVVVALEQGGDVATVTVTDHGAGIPEPDLPHVFDPFFRSGNVKRVQGTGVGLASAKQIIEQHGGTIAIESREGEGTTVRITLPFG